MATVIVQLEAESEYRREAYGITHSSTYVYRMAGGGLHNRTSPHRIQVWDNTDRPNTDPETWNQYSGKPGPGMFLSPDRKGTDDPITVLTSAESTVITNNGTNTGTAASGQVYGDEVLRIGDVVILRYPDGLLSVPYVLTVRSLADPILIPLVGA